MGNDYILSDVLQISKPPEEDLTEKNVSPKLFIWAYWIFGSSADIFAAAIDSFTSPQSKLSNEINLVRKFLRDDCFWMTSERFITFGGLTVVTSSIYQNCHKSNAIEHPILAQPQP